MAMFFCRGCAREIHDTARIRPGYGANRALPMGMGPERRNGVFRMGIASLILGTSGLVLGIVSTKITTFGTRLAIAGTVLFAVSLMLLVGLS